MNHFATLPANGPLLLKGARLIVPHRVIERGSLLVEGGRIGRIFETGQPADSHVEALNLAGRTLFPGFIDVHIHGAVGVDALEATWDELSRVSEFLAGKGVTAWLPTLVPAPTDQYERACQSIAELIGRRLEKRGGEPSSRLGARALGVHYEGPFVNLEQCGALHREHFRIFHNQGDISALPVIQHDGAIHMMTLAPEIEGGIELIRELERRDWIVSIGHTRAAIDILDEAFSAGACHMTHFMNAMAPMHHRAPGPIGWGLARADVTCDLIADGVHIDPFMLQLLLRLKLPTHLTLISDAIAAAGLGDGEYKIWGEIIEVKRGRTRNARGNIAGSVITMLDAVRMMRSLNVSESDIAQMASTNPAKLLGLGQECGSIEEGKRADLVALDSEGKVRLTLVGGAVAYQDR